MKLQFFGPLGRVTGSCALLSDERLGVRILVDAGIQQGEGDPDRWNAGPLPFDAASLTHVLLTHAHVDHCGLLPRVVKEGFSGAVLCTPETAALARLELMDAARVSGLYTPDDVKRVRFDERAQAFGMYFPIAQDVFVQMFRTAHILGAAAFRISWGPRGPDQRSILFSGDLGTNVDRHERTLLLRHRMQPQASTYAVVESTYGDRVRDGAQECFIGRTEGLRRELAAARARGGPTVIAAFAMDRLQMLLLDLAYLAAIDPSVAATPVLAHTRLGERISAEYARHVRAKDVYKRGVKPRWLSKSAFTHLGLREDDPTHERELEAAIVSVLDPKVAAGGTIAGLRRVHSWISRREPIAEHHVVLTSSGMLQGGPVVSYLPDVLRDPTATLILPGYASPATVAGALLQLSSLAKSERERLDGAIELPDGTSIAKADVRAHVTSLKGYSAHADQRGILDWLVHEHEGRRVVAARTLFVQHGDDGAREALRSKLSVLAPEMDVLCPSTSEVEHDLDAPGVASRETLLHVVAEQSARIAELEAALRARAEANDRTPVRSCRALPLSVDRGEACGPRRRARGDPRAQVSRTASCSRLRWAGGGQSSISLATAAFFTGFAAASLSVFHAKLYTSKRSRGLWPVASSRSRRACATARCFA